MDATKLRVYVAVAIMGLAAVTTVAIVLVDTFRGLPLPGYIETVAGFLIGFATHELGVQRGVTLAAAPVIAGEAVSN